MSKKQGVRVSKKKPLDEVINDFLDYWDCEKNMAFLTDIIPLVELYNVEEVSDWLKESVSEEDLNNVRLIRTVYLISKIASLHAGKLCKIGVEFRDLWKRIDKEGALHAD